MAQALNKHPSFPERKLAVRDGSLIGPNPTPEQVASFSTRANSLGMTETLGPHTVEDRRRDPLPPAKAASFGRAVPGVEHRIVDPVTGEPMPPGELGEIAIRGYSVMQGLHKKERSGSSPPTGGTGPATADGSTTTATCTSRGAWATRSSRPA
jgi:acyl-CoA synthetase (AMP-forming)/AMP-acid ligase II